MYLSKQKYLKYMLFIFWSFSCKNNKKNVLLEDILTKIDMFVLKILSSGFCVLLKMTKITNSTRYVVLHSNYLRHLCFTRIFLNIYLGRSILKNAKIFLHMSGAGGTLEKIKTPAKIFCHFWISSIYLH